MAGFLAAGALAGLGAGLSSVGEDMRKNDNADAAMGRQQALETWKLQTMQAYKIADQARADAPLNRLSSAAQAKAQEQVPVTAAPVTSLPTDATLQTGGMLGNYDDLVKQAQSLPEADRAPYLAQLQQQRDRANAGAQQAVAGQTRSRTSDEALDAAMADAKLKDPKAYLAGRTLIGDKTVTVGDGATVIDPKTGKVIFDGSGTKSARENERQDRIDARAKEDREAGLQRTEMMIAGRQDRGGGDGQMSKERRLTITTLFNEAGRDLEQNAKALATLQRDPMSSIAKPGDVRFDEIKDLKAKIAEITQRRDRYAKKLVGEDDSSGVDASSSPTGSSSDPSAGLPPGVAIPDKPAAGDNRKAAPLPKLPTGAKQIGTSGGKPVWETPDGRRFVEN